MWIRTPDSIRTAEGLGASYELRLGEDGFHAKVVGGRFEVVRGSSD